MKGWFLVLTAVNWNLRSKTVDNTDHLISNRVIFFFLHYWTLYRHLIKLTRYEELRRFYSNFLFTEDVVWLTCLTLFTTFCKTGLWTCARHSAISRTWQAQFGTVCYEKKLQRFLINRWSFLNHKSNDNKMYF